MFMEVEESPSSEAEHHADDNVRWPIRSPRSLRKLHKRVPSCLQPGVETAKASRTLTPCMQPF